MSTNSERYTISWVDLSDDTHLEDIPGKPEEEVIDALRHWFREGSPAGWCAFQVCPDNSQQQEEVQ
jgi:hypothetical protein